MNFESTEWCPHCDTEQTVTKIVQPCPNCGKSLVACSMCLIVEAGLNCGECENGSKFVLYPKGNKDKLVKYITDLEKLRNEREELAKEFEDSGSMRYADYRYKQREKIGSFIHVYEKTVFSRRKTFKEMYKIWWELGYN